VAAPFFAGVAGCIKMSPYKMDNETAAPHGSGYNMLFVDGHVAWVKRSDYLFPPRSAPNWNNDHQPHPEEWAPTSDWAVQQ
jgi:prepilin-type processing-associated H-X9-DG protein